MRAWRQAKNTPVPDVASLGLKLEGAVTRQLDGTSPVALNSRRCLLREHLTCVLHGKYRGYRISSALENI